MNLPPLTPGPEEPTIAGWAFAPAEDSRVPRLMKHTFLSDAALHVKYLTLQPSPKHQHVYGPVENCWSENDVAVLRWGNVGAPETHDTDLLEQRTTKRIWPRQVFGS